ncbi:Homoserine dehydrogenase [Fulvivirga imtechensis AK7]|uniref:Homoserine dehydrogenase n=1 Tax=Fulvivirga imtechensis AK7 TaxID=1237149 RepID=L8JTU9_9BACT|nr:homoserine dehydrogenase [Fulvivirga imtechensis]ELR71673.1 Homoserine dehydrogenase [Fulvivirga imtechensis AK7]
MTLSERLHKLEKSINVAIIGIGSIGKGLVYQAYRTPGIKPVAISDIKLDKAIECAEWLNIDYKVVSSVSELNRCIEGGKLAVCQEGEVLASSPLIDVLIESSNAILQGAHHALKGISTGQHIVMMNYEAELMYGPYLLQKANEQGVVYTCADGDQPTVIKTLVDEMDLWGFDLVMAGNMKGFMDRYTDPTKIIPEADKRNLDHKMCSSYTDGSKLCVEMAVLANALDLRTAIPGMYGHKIKSIYDIFDAYDFEEIYKDKKPVVDYVLGAEPKGGVFAIGYTEEKFQQYTLDWFPPNMGPGPFYLFYRPYHLGHIEAMACVAEAYLDGSARLQPNYGMKTNVFAYAKRDLEAGEALDGMGGYAAYGLIENLADNTGNPGIPICLAEGIKLKRAIAKDERINLEDVDFDSNDPSFELYFKALECIPKNNDKKDLIIADAEKVSIEVENPL